MIRHALKFFVMAAMAISLVIGTPAAVSLASAGERPAALIRINFDAGATSALVNANLGANGRTRYVLRASVRQILEARLTGPDGAYLVVRRRNGRELSAETRSATSFRGYLPNSGDFIIDVYSAAKGGAYSLFVSVPEKIAFEYNTTSDIVEGELKAQHSHEYVLRAGAGQLMEVSVTPGGVAETDSGAATDGGSDSDGTEPAELQMVIYGVDGSVLHSGTEEADTEGGGNELFFRGELPRSQHYLIVLRAGAEDVEYSLNVIIPRRIVFAKGAVSAVDHRRVKAYSSLHYVVRAAQGQLLQVEVTGNQPVQLIVYGADGDVLQSGMGDAANFEGKLPATQDYILVVKAGESGSTYKIKVTIK